MANWTEDIGSDQMMGVLWPEKLTFSFLSGVDINRICRSRKKGWKMPENTIYVGRPGKYSNPFRRDGEFGDIIYGNASYRRGQILSPWVFIETVHPDRANERLVELYREWLGTEPNKPNRWFVNPVTFTREELISDLKGKNLACWCALDRPCHANLLISIANR